MREKGWRRLLGRVPEGQQNMLGALCNDLGKLKGATVLIGDQARTAIVCRVLCCVQARPRARVCVAQDPAWMRTAGRTRVYHSGSEDIKTVTQTMPPIAIPPDRTRTQNLTETSCSEPRDLAPPPRASAFQATVSVHSASEKMHSET